MSSVHAAADMPALSIVIPTLDEAAGIEAALRSLQPLRRRGAELVLADGGSADGTPARAAAWVDAACAAPRGRASQMNAGARLARAQTLLFLHADTLLPAEADTHVLAAVAAGAHWGRFDVRIAGRPAMLRVVAALMNLRSRLTGIATGDQAIFVDRALWEALGGYAPIPLMEDVELCTRARRVARCACLRERVLVSARRWERRGVARTVVEMWTWRAAYALGVSPATLHRLYYGRR